jgi:hypothetical protein
MPSSQATGCYTHLFLEKAISQSLKAIENDMRENIKKKPKQNKIAQDIRVKNQLSIDFALLFYSGVGGGGFTLLSLMICFVLFFFLLNFKQSQTIDQRCRYGE